MTKTIEEHFEDCKQVDQVIRNANALLAKAKTELDHARAVLEMLAEYQHPKLLVQTEYRSWLTSNKTETPLNVIKLQVRRINELLGDRA